MNINPIEEKKQENQQNQTDQILEQEEEKNAYTIYISVNNVHEKHDITLGNDSTVEDAIIRTINLDNPDLKNVKVEDLEFFLASKKGHVKDDFPPIDKS